MSIDDSLIDQNKITLNFNDPHFENEFRLSYNQIIKIPLRYGIIISILSWYSAIGLVYAIIPEQFIWLSTLTVVYIGSFFGFIIYATFNKKLEKYLHTLGAFSNAWAGLYAIYFCDQFPNGVHVILPAIIFIIFFGSYMVRLKWLAGFLAALTYIIGYHVYIEFYSNLSQSQVLLYAFVGWMTLIFAVLAGRVAETNMRIAFVQDKTITAQRAVIEKEKELLLQEVHHRVQNNLQIIVSLIKLQLSKSDHSAVNQALTEAQSRILSMSLVHQRINHNSNFTNISLSEYTEQLVSNIKKLHHEDDVNYELDISNDVLIDIDTAIPLGLIINEIVTNFFQHVHANNQCSFSIKAKQTLKSALTFAYSDNGQGFPNYILESPAHTLGLELIQSLSEQIDADFKFYNESGAVYEIYFDI